MFTDRFQSALVASSMFLLGSIAIAQSGPQSARPLNARADDERQRADLIATGERREGKLVVLFTPAGALPDAEEAALLERLETGVAALRAAIGQHSWQLVRDQRIAYYISNEPFVSHASDGAVYIPLDRVQDGRAPYLHEAAHVLLAAPRPAGVQPGQRLPRWLTEGLPDVLAQTA